LIGVQLIDSICGDKLTHCDWGTAVLRQPLVCGTELSNLEP